MSLAVVDASVLTAFYAASADRRREEISQRLSAGSSLFAPALLDAEVVSALRGLSLRAPALTADVPTALTHLAGMPLRRMPLPPLLERMWSLQSNVTAYDAAYVALAEQLDAPLLTCDRRLAAATGPECEFELLG